MKKEFTEQDFKKDQFGEDIRTISSSGYWSEYSHCYDINMSSEWSLLIREIGRWTRNYGSDLLIDYASVMEWLQIADDDGSRAWYFGIRESGVDGLNYILAGANNNGDGYVRNRYYGGIYRMVFTKTGNRIESEFERVVLN